MAAIVERTDERFDDVTPLIPMSESSAAVIGGVGLPPAAVMKSLATMFARTCNSE